MPETKNPFQGGWWLYAHNVVPARRGWTFAGDGLIENPRPKEQTLRECDIFLNNFRRKWRTFLEGFRMVLNRTCPSAHD